MAQAAADLVICLFVAEIRFVMGLGRVWCVYKSRAYYLTANGLPSSVAAARFSVFATNRGIVRRYGHSFPFISSRLVSVTMGLDVRGGSADVMADVRGAQVLLAAVRLSTLTTGPIS